MQNRVINSYKRSQDYIDSRLRNFLNPKKNILSLCNLGLRQSKYKENGLVQQQVSPNMARAKLQLTPMPQQILLKQLGAVSPRLKK
jgi:hypothetical protein